MAQYIDKTAVVSEIEKRIHFFYRNRSEDRGLGETSERKYRRCILDTLMLFQYLCGDKLLKTER